MLVEIGAGMGAHCEQGGTGVSVATWTQAQVWWRSWGKRKNVGGAGKTAKVWKSREN